jgi:hypothetical protein
MIQWHPVFAQLLRRAVEDAYDVQTNMPVGDMPRLADFVLLRRTAAAAIHFLGLWRYLTMWNILEFKGPSVSPRRFDVELLVELGLGIERRLREQHARAGQRSPPAAEVSFWYLANHLGRRFLHQMEPRTGPLDALGPGLWRCRVLGRMVFWVSGIDLPVEADSLPLHIVGREPPATERAVAQLLLDRPDLQQRYGGFAASLHPSAWKEIEAMARTLGKPLKFDILPAVESLGLEEVIKQIGLVRLVEQVGLNRLVDEFGLNRLVDEFGLNRLVDEFGLDRLIEEAGKKEVVKRIGLDDFLANLSPAERRELKRRLQ